MTSDSQLLDIKRVDIQKMEMVDDVPMIIVSCATDELVIYRNKAGDIVLGSDSVIRNCSYIFCFSRKKWIDQEPMEMEEMDLDTEAEAEAGPVIAKKVEHNDYDHIDQTGGWIVVDWSRGII